MAPVEDNSADLAVALVDEADDGTLTLHWNGAEGMPASITHEGLAFLVDLLNERRERAMSAEAVVAILRSDNTDDLKTELLELRDLNESYRRVISNLTGVRDEEASP